MKKIVTALILAWGFRSLRPPRHRLRRPTDT